jgi:hypothetical protein
MSYKVTEYITYCIKTINYYEIIKINNKITVVTHEMIHLHYLLPWLHGSHMPKNSEIQLIY